MSNNILKLVVNTNNNIRFIVSLPSDLTIHKALPVILKKYKSVVSENFGDHPEFLNVNTISHLTKNNCFFAKDEVLGHVLNNNDELEVTVLHKNKEPVDQKTNKPKDNSQQNAVKHVEEASKKQKLETKKNQKAKKEEPKKEEPKKEEPKTKAEENKLKQQQQYKKAENQTKKQIKKDDTAVLATNLLSKLRGQKPKEPEPTVSQKKVVVVQYSSSQSS